MKKISPLVLSCFKKKSVILFLLFFTSCLSYTSFGQVNNWIGSVSTDYFNKYNWSDTNINFTNPTAYTLQIGAGSPNNCVLNGGNSSNVNFRPGRLNTLSGGVFTENGAVYPNNNDSLNGTIILNSPADFNLRSDVYVGRNANATVNINGGRVTSRLAMNIAFGNAGSSATINLPGGSLNAGTNLNIANGTGLTGRINITGGSVNVPGTLTIGAGGSIYISGIGLFKLTGNKKAQLDGLVADGRLSCPAGRTLAIVYDGTSTTASLPVNTNSMIREYPDSIVLNNGIIVARIEKATANILSLKYNGIEQLNQIGTSRTGAYHDFQTTSKGFETLNNCVFTIKTDSVDVVDISLKRAYNAATGQVTPVDADIHYVLNKGDTGLYSYSILEHKPEYPTFDLGSWRLVEWIAQDGTNYLCERIYVDSLRNWQMPSVYDFNNAEATGIAEIVKLTTGVRAGKFDGKYEFTTSFWETPVWGHASSVNHIGTWVVLSSPEYFNGGPAHQDLNAAAGINHILLNGLHYGDKDFTIPQGEQWSKIYGPYLLYTSAKQTGDQNWADAKRRAEVEKAKWPYAWLTNTPEYPLANQRGSISGKFIISDPFKPLVKGQNAWIGVTKISNADNQWQHEHKNYHYWVKTDANGNFNIANVRPGTYTLFAYTDGAVGEYSQQNVTVTAGTSNNLGNVTWNIPRTNGDLLWEIGIPNRKANEFVLGKFDYCEGFVERKFRDTFPATIEYNVAENNWATRIPFAHTKYPTTDFQPGDIWKWRINFNLPANTPATGNAKLTFAYASNDHAQQWIYVNGETSTFATYFPDNGDGNAFVRQANYAKYSTKEVLIPMSRLRPGANTITLAMPSNSLWVSHIMYDYISLEANTGTLPVSLLMFEAQAVSKSQVKLSWTTSAEINNRHFEIERSEDGQAFNSIAIVPASVISTNASYTFIDNNPFAGNNYYRLKQVDKDGNFTYSALKKVNISDSKLIIFPNPAVNQITVTSTSGQNPRSIKLFNAEGRLMYSNTNITASTTVIRVSNYPSGVYIIKVNDGKQEITEKIRKQ